MVATLPSRAVRLRVWWLAVPVAAATAILGLAGPASAVTDTQPPTTPGTPVASNITDTSLTLTWAPSTDDVGVVGYRIQQLQMGRTILRAASSNSVTLTGLSPSWTYQFAVSALDAAGNSSGVSGSVKVMMLPGDTTPPTQPGTPAVTAVTSTSADLNWAASSDNIYVAGYDIVRINGATVTVVARTPQSPPTGSNPSGRVTGLTPNTTYTFAVRARDDAGNVSQLSSAVTVSTPAAEASDVTAPSSPGQPVASNITTTGYKLTWAASTDNVGVVSYRVSTVMLAGSLLPYLKWTTSTNSITITGLVPGQTLNLEVYALDAAGNTSRPSLSTSVTTAGPTDTVAPTAPGTPVASNVTTGGVDLTWAPSTDNVAVAAYGVSEIAVLGGVTIASSRTNSVHVTSLSPNRTYTFRVFAIDWAQNRSPVSGTVTITTPATNPVDTGPPTAPGTPLPANLKPTSVTLSWSPSTDDVGVVRYDVIDLASSSRAVAGSSTTTSVALTGLTPNHAYIFVVVAVDAAGNTSPQSGPLSLTTPPDNVSSYTVIYKIIAQWQGGFQAEVTIRNGGTTAVNGWSLSWTFPNGQKMGNVWGGGPPIIGPVGDVTVPNAAWNAVIPAGGSVSFGFNGTWTGVNNPPTAFTLNGVPCIVG